MINKATLLGRLGKDPEHKHLSNGNQVVNFSVATSEKFKDKNTGEVKETTQWHNIVIWGNLAEVCAKYLHKGDLVYLEGKITNRSWEKDGITRYTTEIVCHEMKMLSTKKDSGQQGQQQQPNAPIPEDAFDKLPKNTPVVDEGGELPF